MMGPGETIALLTVVSVPTILLIYLARRFFGYREKKLEAEMTLAAEKAAQYAASSAQLEARVRVLEQIVTDGGAQTAAQIEALRDQPRMATGETVR
jgi:hypothetical protein